MAPVAAAVVLSSALASLSVSGRASAVPQQLTGVPYANAMCCGQVTDFAGGTNFILLAVLTLLLADSYTTRQVYVTCLVVVSRGELALFLLNRVLSRGKDSRFDEMRAHLCVRAHEPWLAGPVGLARCWLFRVGCALLTASSLQHVPSRRSSGSSASGCSK